MPIATYSHKKPSFKILKKLDIGKGSGNLLVIGDKISVDGLFAWNIGAEFIKSGRKISGKESFLVKLINFADDIIWKILKLLKLI